MKVLRSGQLTIPAELRHALSLEEGADVLISLDGKGGLHLRPLPAVPPLEELLGSLNLIFAKGLPGAFAPRRRPLATTSPARTAESFCDSGARLTLRDSG